MTRVFSRARPMLGTVVTLRIGGLEDRHDVAAVMAVTEQAFARVAHVGDVMSAHAPDSDLGRMSRAMPQEVLELDADTVKVLRAAQYWTRRSGGAFNPVRAGLALTRLGLRPGLNAEIAVMASILDICILSDRHVRMPSALSLDFGGIAKGYAVDQAALCLMQAGISSALINAGGDIRVVGGQAWPVDVRHADRHLRDRELKQCLRMASGAVATSASNPVETAFVPTVGRRLRPWRSATVKARDCMTADALTKWALQSSLLCPSLKLAMRQHHASMWRS